MEDTGMMMLGIYTKVTQAAAAEMVQDYLTEYWAAWGIDIKPKATADPKPSDQEDLFAIPGAHRP